VALCSWECPGIDENFSASRGCSGAVTIIAQRVLVADSIGKALRAGEQANVVRNENRGFARRLVALPAIEELQENENCPAKQLGVTIFAVSHEAESRDLRRADEN
jgi:hypothetical protein